ncbi:MAG: hypothetical protein ABI378_03770 [Chitinophagaceae bacterium]
MNLLISIIAISVFSALLPVIIGYKERSILWYYAVIAFIADVFGIFCHYYRYSSSWTVDIFFLLEWLLISQYLILSCFTGKSRFYANIISILVALLYIIQTLVHGLNEPNLQGAAPFYVFYILGAMVAFYRVTQNIEIIQIEKSPIFVFSTGLLLYASGSLIMILLKRYLDEANESFSAYMWIVHDVLNVIKNVAIAFTLHLQKRKPL